MSALISVPDLTWPNMSSKDKSSDPLCAADESFCTVSLTHDNHQLDVSPGGAEYSTKLCSSNDPDKISVCVSPSVGTDGNVGIKAGITIPFGKR